MSNVVMPPGKKYKFYFKAPTITLDRCMQREGGVAGLRDMRPRVSRRFDVPASQELALAVHAVGVQIYKCVEHKWKFYGPAANLYCGKDESSPVVGKHLALENDDLLHLTGTAPIWHLYSDANPQHSLYFIKNNPVVKLRAPKALGPVQNVAWLRVPAILRKNFHRDELLSPFSYVQRVFTSGGGDWASKSLPDCVDGATQASRYEATYLFYEPKPKEE
ncbi:MAG: DUF3455 domain-containing protein [Elusimicrobia bacterium]|nr:DUF3455 domain-containing protein [Elusimicrobiota bacterium]